MGRERGKCAGERADLKLDTNTRAARTSLHLQSSCEVTSQRIFHDCLPSFNEQVATPCLHTHINRLLLRLFQQMTAVFTASGACAVVSPKVIFLNVFFLSYYLLVFTHLMSFSPEATQVNR